jgi:intracellular multiplication protein IcmP
MADGKADGGTEQMMGWAMIFVVLAVCLYVVYYIWTPEILNAVRWIRFGEMWLVSSVTPDSYMITLTSGDQINLKEWLNGVKNIPTEKIDFQLIVAISAVAMTPIKWAVMAILILMALWAYIFGPGTQYIEIFNLDRFINHQAKAFKIISPFARFNPSNQPPRAPGSPVPAELPMFAEALGPEEWLAYEQIPIPDGKIDQKMAFDSFSKQLGPRWRGPKSLKPHQQILLASFCLKSARKRDQSDDILSRLASCWSHDKGLELSKDKSLLKEARKVLRNKEIAQPVLKKCAQHAWQTTAMLRALLEARDNGGVLAPATFVWLRAHDRILWYPLNNLGRQSSHMEAIGAMAHFRIEKRAKRPIPRPKVHDAVQSITEYMDAPEARPIPTLDYSQSKNKRGIKKLKTT